MKSLFVNFSNHPTERWSGEQLSAAQAYGEVVDLAFPQVSAYASTEDVCKLATETIAQIEALAAEAGCEMSDVTVMAQGEATLVYHVVAGLKNLGTACVAACSDRKSVEVLNTDGTVTKTAVFCFVGFRAY